ncbi:GDSL-type esterase/lipase family protein [Pseudoalteromonas elyakovii]|nr:GDSL-type esterase/lipase family protein [Pseudoalteromonas elyakovii]
MSFFSLVTELESLLDQLNTILAGSEDETVEVNGVTKDSISKAIKDRFAYLEAMVQGKIGFKTKADMDADLNYDENRIAAVIADPIVENNRDYIKEGISGEGQWEPSNTETISVFRNDLWNDLSYIKSSIDSLIQTNSNLKHVYSGEQFYPLKNGWGFGSGFKGFVGGFNVDKYERIKALRFLLNGLNNMARIHVKVYRRSVSSAYINKPDPAFGDVLMLEFDQDVSNLVDNNSLGKNPVDLYTDFLATPDNIYLVEVVGYDELDNIQPMGCVSNTTPDEAGQAFKGYYYNAEGNLINLTTEDTGIYIQAFTQVPVEASNDVVSDLVGKITSSLGNTYPLLTSDVTNGLYIDKAHWAGRDFFSWAFAKEFTSAEYVHAVHLELNILDSATSIHPASTTQVRYKVYKTAQTASINNFEQVQPFINEVVPVSFPLDHNDVFLSCKFMAEPGFKYFFVIEGLDSQGAFTALGVSNSPSLGLGGEIDGMFKKTPSNNWGYVANNSIKAKTVGYNSEVNLGIINKLLPSFEETNVFVAGRNFKGTHWKSNNTAATFDAWAVGFTPRTKLDADTAILYLGNLTSNTGVEFQLMRREIIDDQSAPGALIEDEVLINKTYSLAELGVENDELMPIPFDVSSVGPFEVNTTYFLIVKAIGGLLDCGQSYNDLANEDKVKRGFYSNETTDNFVPVGGDSSIAWELRSNQFQIKKQSVDAGHVHAFADIGVVNETSLDVSIPSFVIKKQSGDITVAAQTLAITAPVAYLNENIPYTLKFDDSGKWFGNANAELPYRYIRNVTVRRTSDNALLNEGVDYDVFYNGGRIAGKKDIADTPVKITYNGYHSRYDIIQLNPMTGQLSVVEGFERYWDPEEYMVSPDTGCIALFSVYAYGQEVQLIPMHNWRGIIRDNFDRYYLTEKARSRATLSKLIGKLNQQSAITIAGYGDSITAQGSPANYDEPNGPNRDGLGFYGKLPADTRGAFEVFDHGDGAGAVHQHFGWNYALKAKFEELGSNVTYLNFGIGGSWSANYLSETDNNQRGGLEPGRLNAMLSYNPDVVVVAFGMNEIGSSNTTQNVADIATACKAAGADVIILGCPRPNSFGGRCSLEDWQLTNDRLYLAAESAGVAFVSTTYIENDDALGFSGMSGHSLCASGGYNHPGPAQLKAIGKALVDLFNE